MEPITRKSGRKRALLIGGGILALLAASCLLIATRKPVLSAGAEFLSYTNARRGVVTAVFKFKNLSKIAIRPHSYSFNGETNLIAGDPISANEARTVELRLAGRVEGGSKLALVFQPVDTPFENFREGLDRAFGAVGLRIPGLNPDSTQNRFEISCKLPEQAPGFP